MAKHANKSYARYGKDNFKFLNRKLTAEQKREFDVWFADEETVNRDITIMYHTGYKASVTFYAEEKIYNVVWMSSKDGEKNVGYGLSSKSTNWYRALCMGVYKHHYITAGEWSTLDDTDEEDREG